MQGARDSIDLFARNFNILILQNYPYDDCSISNLNFVMTLIF